MRKWGWKLFQKHWLLQSINWAIRFTSYFIHNVRFIITKSNLYRNRSFKWGFELYFRNWKMENPLLNLIFLFLLDFYLNLVVLYVIFNHFCFKFCFFVLLVLLNFLLKFFGLYLPPSVYIYNGCFVIISDMKKKI